MTEVSSNDTIADHHAATQRTEVAYLWTLNVVTTMPGGGGVRALLIRLKPRKPLSIRRRIDYFCSDRTIREAKLYSTNADGIPTPPFKRGVVGIQEICSPGETSNSEDVSDSDKKSRP
jgi:hypothetical protein